MIERHDPGSERRLTLGADKGYDTAELRGGVPPHVRDTARGRHCRNSASNTAGSVVLPVAVQGINDRVEVEDDALGRSGMRLQEQRHVQPLESARVMADLVVAAGCVAWPLPGRMLQPVERALARHRRTPLAPRLELAGQSGRS